MIDFNVLAKWNQPIYRSLMKRWAVLNSRNIIPTTNHWNSVLNIGCNIANVINCIKNNWKSNYKWNNLFYCTPDLPLPILLRPGWVCSRLKLHVRLIWRQSYQSNCFFTFSVPYYFTNWRHLVFPPFEICKRDWLANMSVNRSTISNIGFLLFRLLDMYCLFVLLHTHPNPHKHTHTYIQTN